MRSSCSICSLSWSSTWLTCLGLRLGDGWRDFGLGLEVAAIGIAIDQINSNIVAPRILGNLTGLNPVWVVISLLIGAKLGGVVGLLVAIPLASFIKDIADNWRNGQFKETSVNVDIEYLKES